MSRNSPIHIIILFLLLFVACEKDYTTNAPTNALYFSADTLSFDTIFTAEKTTAFRYALYNRSSENIEIKTIALRGEESSPFTVNIDGEDAYSVQNARIRAKDSLMIFIYLEIPETDDEEPFAVYDYIDVTTDNYTETLVLQAFGQNVNRIPEGTIEDLYWGKGKPYLVQSTATIPSLSTLYVEPGARIYMADDAQIDVYGTIIIDGTPDERVVVKAQRNESMYDDIPGQWNGINIQIDSKGNQINFAEIANASYALTVDSAAELTMSNVILRDASHGAMLTFAADVEVDNSIFYNCGGPLFETYGGRNSLIHCTLSNYFSWQTRYTKTLVIHNEPEVENFFLANSIVIGNLTDEIDLDTEDTQNIIIQNSLLRQTQDTENPCYVDDFATTDAGFVDRQTFDFHLKENSTARDIASLEIAEDFPEDFDQNSRLTDQAPDAGAYEYYPEQ